jgi:hypothetical protein
MKRESSPLFTSALIADMSTVWADYQASLRQRTRS